MHVSLSQLTRNGLVKDYYWTFSCSSSDLVPYLYLDQNAVHGEFPHPFIKVRCTMAAFMIEGHSEVFSYSRGVCHFHFHVLGKKKSTWQPKSNEYAKIKNHLNILECCHTCCTICIHCYFCHSTERDSCISFKDITFPVQNCLTRTGFTKIRGLDIVCNSRYNEYRSRRCSPMQEWLACFIAHFCEWWSLPI